MLTAVLFTVGFCTDPLDTLTRVRLPLLQLSASEFHYVIHLDRKMSTTPRSAPSSSAAKVQSAPAFLEKLYEILSDSSNGPYISWQADGTAFLIKKVAELQEIVLPKYFKHNNLQSFVRQLKFRCTFW